MDLNTATTYLVIENNALIAVFTLTYYITLQVSHYKWITEKP